MQSFAKFEHEGWQRVAGKYDAAWASSTRQFISPLLDAVEVSDQCQSWMLVAVLATSRPPPQRAVQMRGPGFFHGDEWDCRRMFPGIEFQEGDAENLPFVNETFDRVLANFTLLHVSDPERACAAACRVLTPGGKFGFTVWAAPEENPYAKMIDNVIREHADMEVDLAAGPPHHLFSGREDFRRALAQAGFDGKSMIFKLHSIYWNVPTTRFPFDAEHAAGVRTAGLLARQTPARLHAIQCAIEESVRRFAKDNGFAISTAAYIIAARKKERMAKDEERTRRVAA